MKNLQQLLILALGAVFTSCAPSPAYSICFRSGGNVILASGTMKIKEPLPPEGKTRGTFVLKLNNVPRDKKDVDWFYRIIGNGEHSKVEWTTRSKLPSGWLYRFNFNPGRQDSNICATVPELTCGKAVGFGHMRLCQAGLGAEGLSW